MSLINVAQYVGIRRWTLRARRRMAVPGYRRQVDVSTPDRAIIEAFKVRNKGSTCADVPRCTQRTSPLPLAGLSWSKHQSSKTRFSIPRLFLELAIPCASVTLGANWSSICAKAQSRAYPGQTATCTILSCSSFAAVSAPKTSAEKHRCCISIFTAATSSKIQRRVCYQ